MVERVDIFFGVEAAAFGGERSANSVGKGGVRRFGRYWLGGDRSRVHAPG